MQPQIIRDAMKSRDKMILITFLLVIPTLILGLGEFNETHYLAIQSTNIDHEKHIALEAFDGTIFCNRYQFCTGIRWYASLSASFPVCYGSYGGCKWGSFDCSNDAHCTKYSTLTSPYYRDSPDCPYHTSVRGVDHNYWGYEACIRNPSWVQDNTQSPPQYYFAKNAAIPTFTGNDGSGWTWQSATTSCNSNLNGWLAVPTNQVSNNFIGGLITADTISWIGGYISNTNPTYGQTVWQTGSYLSYVYFSGFTIANNPSACIFMYTGSNGGEAVNKWHTTTCSLRFSYVCQTCLPGTYLPPSNQAISFQGQALCQNCPVGTFTSAYGTKNACSPCASGTIAASPGQSVCIACPATTPYINQGKSACCQFGYTPIGLGGCVACTAGTRWDASTLSCITCPPGTFSSVASSSCTPCPAGSFAPNSNTPGQCTPAPRGKFIAGSGASVASQLCDDGFYSIGGATACTSCATGTPEQKVTQYWTTGGLGLGTSTSSCICKNGYTGLLCNLDKCSDKLSGMTLGALLLAADIQLRKFSDGYTDSMEYFLSVNLFVKNLVFKKVDISGDGLISRDEMIDALKFKGVFTEDGLSSFRVWCPTVDVADTSKCYDDAVPTRDFFRDVMNNFKFSPEHRFDSTGSRFVRNMTSTYPSPSYSLEECGRFDQSSKRALPVQTSWKLATIPPSGTSFHRICGYINGILSDNFIQNNALASGDATKFEDKLSVSMGGYKRVYCISVDYKYTSSVTSRATFIECSVGLFYDGSPIDLDPFITSEGISFSYFDTSRSESLFEIFSGTYRSTQIAKDFLVGIPYISYGCGRTARHISILDKLHKDDVGIIQEYSIRAVKIDGNVTSASKVAYRVPFYSRISGQVLTNQGVPVENVSVTLCHIDPITGEDDSNADYCPLVTIYTDKLGYFSADIKISDVSWTNTVEYFTVTPVKVDTMLDGDTLEHIFLPPKMRTSLDHLTLGTKAHFTDNTTISLFGKVAFDPANVKKADCPMPGVPVHMIDSSGNLHTTEADIDGLFNFAVDKGTEVSVFIPSYMGYRWLSNIISEPTENAKQSRKLLLNTGDDNSFVSIRVNQQDSFAEDSSDQLNISPGRLDRKLQATVTSTPTVLPSRAPTRSLPSYAPTTSLPSYAPSTISPTVSPSVRPTTPTRAPTFTPSRSPTFKPTVVPSQWPTQKPTSAPSKYPTFAPTTSAPTVFINYSTPQLLHEFIFDGRNPKDRRVYGSDRTSYVELFGPTLDGEGSAVFQKKPGYPTPYIKLPYASLGTAEVITMEFWISFDIASAVGAPLLAFGNPETYEIQFLTTKKMAGNAYYITFVFNPSTSTAKVYLNGTLDQTVAIPSAYYLIPALGKNSLVSNNDFIGRNVSNNGPGLIAKLGCVRIWSGELSLLTIKKHFLVGFVTNQLTITSDLTFGNVNVSFLATSVQNMRISFLGGDNVRTRMFGKEMIFNIVAKPSPGAICAYKLTLPLDDEGLSSVSAIVPAMNLTITLDPKSSTVRAQEISNVIPRDTTPFFCDRSKSPYQYLSDANQLSQDLIIDEVPPPNFIYPIIYTYHSGVCFQIAGAEKFSNVSGNRMIKADSACYADNQVTMLEQGENTTLQIMLFERYLAFGGSEPYFDYNVTGGHVYYSDGPGGGVSSNQAYNATFPKGAYMPIAQKYTISALTILPVIPFASYFRIYVERIGPDGTSSTRGSWYIPVLGVLSKEVPNLFPVSTDQNLIFFVIRDPPGGASSTTVHSGTTVNFGISLDNMYTTDMQSQFSGNAGVGFEVDNAIAAGLGVMAVASTLKLGMLNTFEGHKSVSMSHSRASATSYQLSMTFEYEFSTSSDPYLAGHLSDIIVGGGLDIIVSQATKVLKTTQVVGGKTFACISAVDANQWQPSVPTTFVLSVYEIEMILDRLRLLANPTSATTNSGIQPNVTKYIKNWESILETYRSHNVDQASVFSQESMLMHSLVESFNRFEQGMLSETDFVNAFDSLTGNSILAKGMPSKIRNGFSELTASCTEISRMKLNFQTDFVQCADLNLDPTKWEQFGNLVDAACRMGSPESTSNNPLIESNIIKAQCRSDPTKSSDDPTLNEPAMFDFLKKNHSYLTFGAGSPTTMSWTSTATNAYQFTSELNAASGDGFSNELALNAEVFSARIAGGLSGGNDKSVTINIGKTSDVDHQFSRAITVNLDDEDHGDYFAVRVTQDTVYGTPIFTTMGGQSKCPGETGTSRRESNVKILQILSRCGPNKDSECTASNTGSGVAMFSIFLFNDSPTGEEVDYQLQLTQDFDSTPTGDYATMTCDISGNMKDLFQNGFSVTLSGIPFRKIVERAITIPNGVWCKSYSGIQIQAIATCEADMSVYQYGVVKDPESGSISISYEPEDRIYASSSTATIPDFAFPQSSGESGGGSLSVNSDANNADTGDIVDRIFSLMIAAVLLLFLVLIIVLIAVYQLFRVKHHAKTASRSGVKGHLAQSSSLPDESDPQSESISLAGVYPDNSGAAFTKYSEELSVKGSDYRDPL